MHSVLTSILSFFPDLSLDMLHSPEPRCFSVPFTLERNLHKYPCFIIISGFNQSDCRSETSERERATGEEALTAELFDSCVVKLRLRVDRHGCNALTDSWLTG